MREILFLLKHPQQAHLSLGAELGYFVQKQSPFIRQFKLPELRPSVAPVNAPFSWPNNSASIEGVRHGPAIQRDERLRSTMTGSVQFQGHQFFSNAGLTLDADTHIVG